MLVHTRLVGGNRFLLRSGYWSLGRTRHPAPEQEDGRHVRYRHEIDNARAYTSACGW